MSIYYLFIINKAGSLIFDWENKSEPPVLSANDKIIIASTFHSMYAIAAQVSPAAKSSGIKLLETTQFRLHCFQSKTCVKFIVVTSLLTPANLDSLLRKIYELYADFALKNPFYSIDMPIRCDKFDAELKLLLEKQEKSSVITL